MNILVVCLGNICRSPMAEGILRKKITDRKLNIKVDSAGTSNYHVDELPDLRAIQTAKINGVDISKLRGRQFTAGDFDRFDRIYAMDRSNYKHILKHARNDSDKKKIFYFLMNEDQGMDVPDPWYGDLEGFLPVYELLDKTSDKILEELLEISKA